MPARCPVGPKADNGWAVHEYTPWGPSSVVTVKDTVNRTRFTTVEIDSPPTTRARRCFTAIIRKRSVLPGAGYPPKDVAGDRHMADGRERQVSGHQRLAVRRQLPQKMDPD